MVALDIFFFPCCWEFMKIDLDLDFFAFSRPPKMHQTTLQEAAPVFKIFVAIIAINTIIVTNMIIISSDYCFHP